MTGRARKGAEPPAEEPEPPVKDPEPDQAWKALGLVNDWIKHAETKVGATLAVTGVTGGALYSLVKNENHPSVALAAAAVACGAFVFVAGACAAVALLPRLRLRWWRADDPTNPLFFGHVARKYQADSPTYIEVLHALTSDKDDLTRHIAHQVHANSTVAHRKYRWANLALLSLVAALAALAATAIILALHD